MDQKLDTESIDNEVIFNLEKQAEKAKEAQQRRSGKNRNLGQEDVESRAQYYEKDIDDRIDQIIKLRHRRPGSMNWQVREIM